MKNVHREDVLPGSVEAAWVWLGDFTSVLKWVRRGDESTIEITGDGIGMLRDLNIAGIGYTQHRLDALDPVNHTITYSVTKGAPLGMVVYSVTGSLKDNGDGTCTVIWDGAFEGTPGDDEETIAANLHDAYGGLSEGLAKLISGRS